MRAVMPRDQERRWRYACERVRVVNGDMYDSARPAVSLSHCGGLGSVGVGLERFRVCGVPTTGKRGDPPCTRSLSAAAYRTRPASWATVRQNHATETDFAQAVTSAPRAPWQVTSAQGFPNRTQISRLGSSLGEILVQRFASGSHDGSKINRIGAGCHGAEPRPV
ncbi:hypothetical protein ANO11243_071510 [Dothideomycetidae sp. 11243]|nr:hypothetical protein ANO11243_071510 [fungal sp. No.11243]